ncbi:MAG TPA: sigma-54 dependent transcriptional regulator [Candidatus Deferrimicrobium sp.]|nr:sigma-54 dependent transcriptional regulator [Candidatus Deferrimicrobium sp.]
MPARILIVDDEPAVVRSFSSLLREERYHVDAAASAEEAKTKSNAAVFDLILLDIRLPGESGIEFLHWLKEQAVQPLVLVVSGQSEIATALQAVKLGAVDYLEKPVPPERLLASVRACLQLAMANRQREALVGEIDDRSRIIGDASVIRKLLKMIDQVAPTDATVLITGENGTGKELVATRLFLQSHRRDKPFIKVNCPGIPSTLFESELFGHVKGAFTGAVKDYPGKFVLADGGTLLFDEIGDLPPECQAKLLRVLEGGEIETLGSVHRRQVDVRVVCATNRNLTHLVTEGKFREDLYYRISVLVINVPCLRDRREDIPVLVGEFLKRFDPSRSTTLSPEALAYLGTFDYPGNVRQLKNVIERLVILFPGRTIEAEDIRDQLSLPSVRATLMGTSSSLSDKVASFERLLIAETLRAASGNISEAARMLKTDRANLSRKIRELGLINE